MFYLINITCILFLFLRQGLTMSLAILQFHVPLHVWGCFLHCLVPPCLALGIFLSFILPGKIMQKL